MIIETPKAFEPERDFVTHLACSETGARYPADRLHGLSEAGAPLLLRYDLEAVAGAVTKNGLRTRPWDLWRYRELLPVPPGTAIVSLGEAVTPLLDLAATRRTLGSAALLVKDEGRLPTGSFKSRGMALAVTMAKAFGCDRLAVPTAGNAGAAAAAYGAAAGLETFVFTPQDTPEVIVREIGLHGAKTFRVAGLINDCGRVVREGTAAMGWHDLSTLAEPYRLEGKKTMGLELAEQLGWRLPDVIYYPTGGGTGFIGMWKAFAELEAMGWIGSERPRMVAVQSTGCGPIVAAAAAGRDRVVAPWAPVATEIHGVRVPKPQGDRLILRVVAESGGHGVAVSDESADATRREVARRDGLHLCPEGALCVAAYRDDLAAGRVAPSERIVVFNTASGLKYPMPRTGQDLDPTQALDAAALR